jgi:hypothetical protein
MSSSKKHFSLVTVLGISLGLACSAGVVNAGSIADSYATGDTLTAAKMTAVKTAVNDNDTRITAIGAGTQTCLAGMTKVGPVCVDNTRTANGSVSWSAAVNACRAANKRLLTPGEYVAALNSGLFADMVSATPNQYEWVDSVASQNAVATVGYEGTSRGRLTVGYMGPDDGSNLALDEIFFGTNADYDNATYTFIGYRCAR